MPGGLGRISKASARRNQLAAEQNHRCCYCGVTFDYDAPDSHPNTPTIEHVIRLGDGGARGWGNEVAACYSKREGVNYIPYINNGDTP